MKGLRDLITGLYMLNFHQEQEATKNMTELEIPDTHFANHVYDCKSKQNLAIYFRLTLFSPPVSTWVKAIKFNYFSTWPGLTADLILRYLPKSVFTSYWHLRQSYKGVRSTKTRQSTNFVSVPQLEPEPEVVELSFPDTSNSDSTHEVYFKIYNIQKKIYTDQTGR